MDMESNIIYKMDLFFLFYNIMNDIFDYIRDIFSSMYSFFTMHSLVLIFFVIIVLMVLVRGSSSSSSSSSYTQGQNGQIFNSFATSMPTFGLSDFLNSTSFVSKLAFLLLVIFVFMVLLRISVSVMSYFMKPSKSPKLINGMVNGTQMMVFPQDINSVNAKTIYRSANQDNGIEFAWSTWIFINSLQVNEGIYKHIFSKGNSDLSGNGMVQPNNAPGLYIAPNKNTLVVVMNTYNVINEEITIPDIPLNKWMNVIIRCQNTKLDVYINGVITRSINLVGIPKQNYGDVIVAMNGGFDGYISNLWYYNRALGTAEIQRIIEMGPNTKMIGGNMFSNTLYNYLSLNWFYGGYNSE